MYMIVYVYLRATIFAYFEEKITDCHKMEFYVNVVFRTSLVHSKFKAKILRVDTFGSEPQNWSNFVHVLCTWCV